MIRISDQTAAFVIHRISRLVLYNRGGECLQRGTHRVLIKVATTCTEDGHKQTTKSGHNMYRGWTQTDYQKWPQHVQRTDTNRLPKQALEYKPKGRRNIERPRNRWRDQLHLEDQGTGNTPNPSGTRWWWIGHYKYYLYYFTIVGIYRCVWCMDASFEKNVCTTSLGITYTTCHIQGTNQTLPALGFPKLVSFKFIHHFKYSYYTRLAKC